MANQGPELLCLKGGSAEVVEKKSRFIAQVSPVKNEEEALQFIARIRKENRDARHNCFAYVTGPDGSIEKFSDDGEPSKTAGMPMLDLLRKRGLKNACVVVTRYFGGILLGTGGLVRAYTAACTAGLDACITAKRKQGVLATWTLNYGLYGKVQYLAEEEGLFPQGCDFGQAVTLRLLMPAEKADRIIKKVREMSAGKAEPADLEKRDYCAAGGEVILM